MKKLIWLLGVVAFVWSMGLNPIEASEKISVANEEVYESFCLARQEYEAAKHITDAKERNILYAKAISDISRAVNAEPTNSAYWMMGSQIYRSKGAVTYAKQYFLRAEQMMLSCLEQNPEDPDSHLDYAIACYAGDVRFWSDYEVYRDKAQYHAQQVLDICLSKKNITRRDFLHMAIAGLILNQRGESDEIMLIAQYGMDNVAKEDELTDASCALYNDTVVQNTWLWNVQAESIDKEFLLYYLTMKAVLIS